MTKKKSCINIKDNIDDDTIDLSVAGLTEVPVKEIASFPKCINVELFLNKITSLGNDFAPNLVHLVKLDLSRNKLIQLPENFGLLVNLKHLDLYSNQIKTLPLSICKLRALRWLDLKENPLEPKLAQVVGSCADAAACQLAAKKVNKYLGELYQIEEEEMMRREAQRKKQLEANLLKQAELKKDNNKKKKKKKPIKAVEVKPEVNNGKIHAETDDATSKVDYGKNHKKFSSFAVSICSFLFKIVISVLFLLVLSILIISQLDEQTYLQIKTILSKKLDTVLPIGSQQYFSDFFDLILQAFKAMLIWLKFAFKFYLYKIAELLTELKRNENIYIYLNEVGKYANIGFTKSVEVMSMLYNNAFDSIKQYIT